MFGRQNTILDFFKQSMTDYVLGINPNAFVEFSEKMQASDPGEILRLTAIRKMASEQGCLVTLVSRLIGYLQLTHVLAM